MATASDVPATESPPCSCCTRGNATYACASCNEDGSFKMYCTYCEDIFHSDVRNHHFRYVRLPTPQDLKDLQDMVNKQQSEVMKNQEKIEEQEKEMTGLSICIDKQKVEHESLIFNTLDWHRLHSFVHWAPPDYAFQHAPDDIVSADCVDYVFGRADFKTYTAVGIVNINNPKECLVPTPLIGQEKISRDFMVLVGSKYTIWEVYRNGKIPSNAISGGLSKSSEHLYIGRYYDAKDYRFHPGIIYPKQNCILEYKKGKMYFEMQILCYNTAKM